jgi:hypothetical protein
MGECLLGFHSEPTLDVVLSKSASEASGVRFIRAFRMLVKEH